jgi:hypothetical protein
MAPRAARTSREENTKEIRIHGESANREDPSHVVDKQSES